LGSDFLRFREEITGLRLENGLQKGFSFGGPFWCFLGSLLEQVQGGDYIAFGM